MSLQFKDGCIVFSSGHKRYAYDGSMSLQAVGDNLEIGYGADGGFYYSQEWEVSFYSHKEDEGLRLTPADIVELADHMIDRWALLRKKMLENTE